MIRKIVINSLIICVTLGVTLNKVNAQFKADSLTYNLKAAFLKDSLPGLSVVLVNAHKVIYQKNFGYADVGGKVPYTTSTVQNIGSVSKTVIAVALMKAIELKYFTLETDINEILPFKVVNPNQPDSKITIRELANHTSGIIDNPEIYSNSYKFYPKLRSYDSTAFGLLQQLGFGGKVKDTTMKSFFYNYLAQDGKYYSKANFGQGLAGGASTYSNVGSALVAYLIEIKSGLSYADFTSKYILAPLKMAHSGWSVSSVNLKDLARLYYDQSRCFPLYDLLTYPDGGLKTSAADLSKYLMAMINGYHGDKTLLDPVSFKTMFAPQFSKEHPPKNINLTYRNKGIFWNLYTNGTIGHDGDDPGVGTFLFFNPGTGIGGLFLTNKYLPNKQLIVDILVKAASCKP
ncbi:serine hydrolase [Mucilaginibacter sp. OK283]|uniref:serine hydrolase domain-containing protein n=1 Tax=Mucilaginibacter sp. OK283 TaxID=1881049 RepID=UPI0008D6076D|nr:serine hydrolase domain-containing protein [Mucilaginibacter sp. OK283]SEO04586.1 CubicO group peptidase, beta-lactamase class C family [Mucilaginibacter sp. OK283]